MLGKLAKWLKILGFDVLYFSKVEDSELLALAKREGRTVLSRDNEVLQKARSLPQLYVESESWQEQVEQVLCEFDLWDKADPYSRCLECNVKLKRLPKKEARNLVSSYIYEQANSFALCPQCGKVFWPGTHYNDMEFKIDEILNKGGRGKNMR